MQSNQSWDHVANWYDSLVGGKGQYYHQNVIFPSVTSLLDLKSGQMVLDLACGQGAFARELTKKNVFVTGIDASSRLIESARRYEVRSKIEYLVDDARTLKTLEGKSFNHIVSILALQNMDPIDGVFKRVSQLLKPGGTFTIAILHPAFRSPRITGWGEDERRKLQFRRVDRYITPMKIPIDMHPSLQKKYLTWTYHRPLQEYIRIGTSNGLAVTAIKELVSNKVSEGKHAKMENLARSEIPMFMVIRYSHSYGP